MSYLPGRPLLFAHRGAAAELPENTVPSFARALEIGVDALELDVHMTVDGHLVVSHDPSAQRMAGVRVRFRDVTLADVKSWDAGYGFVDANGDRPFAGKDIRIPTLEEILIEFSGVPLNIDLKQPQPPVVTPALDLLRRTKSSERVTLASFHTSTMLAVRRAGYGGPTALSRNEVGSLLTMPKRVFRGVWKRAGGLGRSAQVPPRVGPVRFDTTKFIAKCHALGMRVEYWTINDPNEAKRLLDLGADGIMTDDPRAIKPVFAKLR